jgi:type II secretion system protein H
MVSLVVKAKMPTLATGISTTEHRPTHRKPPGRAAGGFTLLEMLVVVFIVALLAGAAIIGLGATGKDSGLEKERDRLSMLMSYARERGALLTIEYGIRCGQHGYRFVYYDNRTRTWLPETFDETLRLRKLPPGINVSLIIEGHQIVLDDKSLAIPKALTTPAGGKLNTLGSDTPSTFTPQDSDNGPQILLLSNGDVNSFTVTLARDGTRRSTTVLSKADGTIESGAIVEPK